MGRMGSYYRKGYMIPLEECKHGYLYKLYSRNLDYGVYNAAKKGFTGIRIKFGSRYLFTEYHWDTGAPYGTAKAVSEVKQCPINNLNEGANPDLFDWLKKNE